jgi:hypothetical protein
MATCLCSPKTEPFRMRSPIRLPNPYPCSRGRRAGASFSFANTGCVSYLRLRDQSVLFNSLSNADRGSFERIRNGCCNEDLCGRQTCVPRRSQRLPAPRKRFSRPEPLWPPIRSRIGMRSRTPNPRAGDRQILLKVGNCSILPPAARSSGAIQALLDEALREGLDAIRIAAVERDESSDTSKARASE